MIKSIKKLIANLDYEILNGEMRDFDIGKVCYDSKKVAENDLFICLKGARFDSHSLLSEIIKDGAKVIVVNKDNEYIKDFSFDKDVVVLGVKNERMALSIISSNYFDNPKDKLKIIGITGTKGKTTTAFMIRSVLMHNGYKVGMIGTIGIFFENEHILTDNTTPESFILHEYFRKMLDRGIQYVVMEVSSQSLKYHRVYGIDFYFAIWTNIKPEHIGENEHDDYDDYINSKLKIFNQCENALINSFTDDYDRIVSYIKDKTNCKLYEKTENKKFELKIPGDYNQENASLAYRFGEIIGIDDEIIKKALSDTVVPGRIETVYSDSDFKVIVDYSYEDNGAKRFLKTIREANPEGRIVAVFGCGGNRSKDRRYGMGKVSGELADFVVLTADNSRYEKTIDIIRDIESTLTNYKKLGDLDSGYVIYEDRREAIEFAIKNRKPHDIICVMGKGHEPLMEMNGEKIHFLDKEVILDIINR